MRFRIGLASSLSVLLIIIALWYRVENHSAPTPALIAVENPLAITPDKALTQTETLSSTESVSLSPSNNTLSATDLLGRQLIMDYVSLATGGQATNENVAKLVDNYIQVVPNINTAGGVSLSNLEITGDSEANFRAYDEATTEIEQVRTSAINQAFAKAENFASLSPEFYSAVEQAGIAYEEAAQALENVPVPTSLATLHLKLVNSYLSTSAGMKSVAKIDSDSMSALAGTVAINDNLAKDKEIVDAIVAILIKNGL